jgi:hypothetical protein
MQKYAASLKSFSGCSLHEKTKLALIKKESYTKNKKSIPKYYYRY